MIVDEKADEKGKAEQEASVKTEEIQEGQEQKTEAKKPEVGEPEYTQAIKKRIDKITKEKYEALKDKEKLQKELNELKSKTITQDRPQRPNAENYKDQYGDIDANKYNQAVTQYEDKLLDWNDRRREVTSQKTVEQKPEIDENLLQFTEQCDKARQKYKDFDIVAEKPVFTDALKKAIIESEYGADLLYYLGSNESLAMRIGVFPQSQLLKEIGKLEMKIHGAQNAMSSAPNPINPINGSDKPRKDVTKMTAAEYYDAKKAGLIKDDD